MIQRVAREPVASTAASAPKKSTRQFRRCVDIILGHEGGYVDHPDDPGGATNMGITFETLRAWRGESITKDDVKEPSESEAREICRANYWNALNCDQLPFGADLATFDFGVNAGVSRATKMLQGIVAVEAEGQIGPITIGAVSQNEA
jgi:lysozyme family protein